LVFARADGQPIEPSRASAAWKSWYTDVRLTDKHVPLHYLRHTFADLLFAARVDDGEKIDLMGHSNRSMTQAYRTKGNQPRLTDALERASALLAREPE
jgi:integrase